MRTSHSLPTIRRRARRSTRPNAARHYHYDHAGSTSGNMSGTPFLWNGAYGAQTDPSGLVYMRARYYHPALGRFITQDPLGLAAGPNVYAYCDGDPVMRMDPSGLFSGPTDEQLEGRSYYYGYVGGGPLMGVDQLGLWNLYKWVYTGDGNAPDDVYNAAVGAAADFIENESGIRGAYIGVGINKKLKGKGNLGGAGALVATCTIDDGLSLSAEGGIGLQDRGRNSKGQFTSQTIGVGGGYDFYNSGRGFESPMEGFKFSGIYGGTGNKAGGGNFGYDTPNNTFMLGLNRGPASGGIIIDVNRMSNNIASTIDILIGGSRK